MPTFAAYDTTSPGGSKTPPPQTAPVGNALIRSKLRREGTMNLEKVIFGFLLSPPATLNFGFFVGDIDRPELHHVLRVVAADVVSNCYGTQFW